MPTGAPVTLIPAPFTCPVCGGAAHHHAFDARDWALGGAPGSFVYVRCDACGSVVQSPPPDDATLAQAYGAYYAPGRDRPPLASRLAEPLVLGEARRLLARADPGLPLLDVGCGTGSFLARLRRVGWSGELRGLEPDPAAAAEARRRSGATVEDGSVETAALAPGALGTIVLRHVIEHVRDPRATVARLHEALAPGGTLYLATPDADALCALAFGRFWHGWDPPRHLVVFTASSLRGLVTAAGFAVTDEHWGFSPEMWTGSLRHALDRNGPRRSTRWLASELNPLAAGGALAGAAAERLSHRATMYGLIARRT